MRILGILLGIILLLPGLCSLGFIAIFIPEIGHGSASDGAAPLVLLWLVCFAISYLGFLMIRIGLRGNRPPVQPRE